MQPVGLVTGNDSARVAPLHFQAELFGERTHLVHLHHLGKGKVVVAHDVVFIFGPIPEVVAQALGRHIDLHAIVLRERFLLKLRRLLVAYDDTLQTSAVLEGAFVDAAYQGWQLYLPQRGAAVESISVDGLDGLGKGNATQLATADEPAAAHGVQANHLELLEVGKRADAVPESSERVLQAREALLGDARKIYIAVPRIRRAAGCRVAPFLQRLPHVFVGRLDDAGTEAVLVLGPRRVGLEPRELAREHLDDAVG